MDAASSRTGDEAVSGCSEAKTKSSNRLIHWNQETNVSKQASDSVIRAERAERRKLPQDFRLGCQVIEQRNHVRLAKPECVTRVLAKEQAVPENSVLI